MSRDGSAQEHDIFSWFNDDPFHQYLGLTLEEYRPDSPGFG